MDDEMIERVAQAICGDNNLDNILTIHRDRVKLAIKAMREPTEKMIDAGIEIGPARSPTSYYQAMIDVITND